MAHRSFGRNRLWEWGTLLVLDETSASGCLRLRLGASSRASPAGSAKSLRYAAGTVSADRGALRSSFCAAAARTCRRTLLGNQFVPPCLRPHASRLHPTTHLFCLSVLGRTRRSEEHTSEL